MSSSTGLRPELRCYERGPWVPWTRQHVSRCLNILCDAKVEILWGMEGSGHAQIEVHIPQEARLYEGEFDSDAETEILGLLKGEPRWTLDPLSPGRIKVSLTSDIFSFIAWIISRGEEYHVIARDDDGHYPRGCSFADLAGMGQEAIADRLMQGLGNALEKACSIMDISFCYESIWPDGYDAALVICHDVEIADPRHGRVALEEMSESVSAWLKGSLQGGFSQCLQPLSIALGQRENPRWLLPQLLEIEAKADIVSSLYMLSPSSNEYGEGSRAALPYDVREDEIRQLMQSCLRRGGELGLLESSRSVEDCVGFSGLRSDLKALRRAFSQDCFIHGVHRSPRHTAVPEVWEQLEEAGVDYDISLSWPHNWGFRSGTSMPFRPFDRDIGRARNLWELAPQLVGCPEGKLERLSGTVEGIIEDCLRYRGCASLVFKSSPPRGSRAEQYLETYSEVIQSIKSVPRLWVVTPRQLLAHLESKESQTKRDVCVVERHGPMAV